MGCIVEINEVRFDFVQNKRKQKTWIEALLHFTNSDAKHLANLLEVPLEMLIKVRDGSVYFAQDTAERLAELFLVAFAD
ncbi:hypothetical protein [Legionella anisa]|uniref:hypothetical protein n=1 Tax=Legionella anisa TaxID=28082 RepID=UPI0010413FE9|nr:hypothetical protein [Legionella anisa]